MYTPGGVCSVVNSITAYEVSQYNWDSYFLICNVFFVSKGNHFDVYFTTLQLVLMPCGCVERLLVFHHIADYISFPLGSLGPL